MWSWGRTGMVLGWADLTWVGAGMGWIGDGMGSVEGGMAWSKGVGSEARMRVGML